ncbi:RNA-directed DNA polymerase (Reverse transcriptase), Ribonuclease H-like protein [Gossypium australe]|uniref:RNA-directed DNA polymerase (Reverse transcriptase), Ribonuclease H-like protein n=1 Tax=Gossypium australe TaxID=47621 RepID=A0A5B6UVY5_9ROSI|nr:RNA-directed DNA polymerase (Reverse transcriptase), Ribonuclease H-like protein [Gossypium australe]
MIFPNISKTFLLGEVVYLERKMTEKESQTANIMGRMFENLSINVVSEKGNREKNMSGIHPYALRSVLNNWTMENILIVFRTISEAPDINDDFEDDHNCTLSSDLLRMVEQDEKQILPHKESVEIVSLGDEKEKKDVFPWSYQDMLGLSTDIVVHRLPIKEECNLVQQKLRRMRPGILLKINEKVKKQFDAGFLQVVKYSKWVAIIVSVPKKDGKVERACKSLEETVLDVEEVPAKAEPNKMHFQGYVGQIAGICSAKKELRLIRIKSMIYRSYHCRVPKRKFGDAYYANFDELGRKERAIYYLSKKFTECETRYSPIEKLCCSLKAIKGSAIADFLASRALEDYEPLNFDFPNEDMMYVVVTEEGAPRAYLWKLNFNGTLNATGNGIGEVLVSLDEYHYPFTNKLNFDCMNNMVEYKECIMGIRAAIERKIKVLKVYEDSALVNKQQDLKPIQMSICEALTHCYDIEEEERDNHPWYNDILQYVKNCKYPEQATGNDKRMLRRLANEWTTSYANVTKLTVSKFLKKESLCRTSTRATPFSLVYGMEAVLPIEVEIPSLRIFSELKLDEVE